MCIYIYIYIYIYSIVLLRILVMLYIPSGTEEAPPELHAPRLGGDSINDNPAKLDVDSITDQLRNRIRLHKRHTAKLDVDRHDNAPAVYPQFARHVLGIFAGCKSVGAPLIPILPLCLDILIPIFRRMAS